MLVNGIWTDNWHPVQACDEKGRFVRQVSAFRNWITRDGSAGPTGTGGFRAEAGRYRLYVALICPWASRTLIARRLKGLDGLIPVTVVNPALGAQGWAFGGCDGAEEDPLFAARHLLEIYTRADAGYHRQPSENESFSAEVSLPRAPGKSLTSVSINTAAAGSPPDST